MNWERGRLVRLSAKREPGNLPPWYSRDGISASRKPVAPLAQHLAVSLRLTVPAFCLSGGYAAQRRTLKSNQTCR
jgi:hypothetical protein